MEAIKGKAPNYAEYFLECGEWKNAGSLLLSKLKPPFLRTFFLNGILDLYKL